MHEFTRELHFLWIRLSSSHGATFYTSCLVIAFAFVFPVMGLARVVEFRPLIEAKAKRRVLISLHLVGCLLLTLAALLLGADIDKRHTSTIGAFFLSSLALLLPIQIYLGLLRRIRLRDSEKR